MSYKFFATCPKGLESLLLKELEGLGLEAHETVAGVSFKGVFEDGLKACLWSRFASRVLLELSEFNCKDDTDLYLGVSGIAFEDWFDASVTIAVDFSGLNEQLRNTQYSALKVKDGICDRLQKTCGARPDVDRDRPDVQIYAHLERRGIATVALDLSGRALMKREFHRGTGTAPLKENLAAAMVARSGYEGGNFCDPMCGSGTLLLEAAALATDTAPGLKRQHYGFLKLKKFDPEKWQALLAEASVRSRRGINKKIAEGIKIIGCDKDANMADIAASNATKAGFSELIEIKSCDLAELKNPFPEGASKITVVTNPPYGKRMGNFNELISLYTLLGAKFKAEFRGARAAVISTSTELLSCLRLHSQRSYKLYNGELECQLRVFDINDEAQKTEKEEKREQIAEDFANRLKKNLAYLRKWAETEHTDCYRVYDADVPEYAAAIDYYNGWYVIQTYKAEGKVSERVEKQHELDMLSATVSVTGAPGSRVILKNRAVQHNDSQYEKAEEQTNRFVVVKEDDISYLVNLEDYLDTGLFLDGRKIRRLIREKAAGKSFLNLFCYTASASVAAAKGGALSTHSVDMSRTYLEWGMRNFKQNGISLDNHTFEQQDCLRFIAKDTRTFDLIYIDPPTFSNSKRMQGVFDVKRDHAALLSNLAGHLNPGGEIIFCTNKRGFKLDESLGDYGLVCEDISEKTLPRDFARDKNIHKCYLITFDPAKKTAEAPGLGEFSEAPRWSGEIKAFEHEYTQSTGPAQSPYGKVPGRKGPGGKQGPGASGHDRGSERRGGHQENRSDRGRSSGKDRPYGKDRSAGKDSRGGDSKRPEFKRDDDRQGFKHDAGHQGFGDRRGGGRDRGSFDKDRRGGSSDRRRDRGPRKPDAPKVRVWGPDGIKEDL